MHEIKNILACLDLTYIDPVMVEYAAFFAETTGAENVYFLHVIQEYDLPDKGGRDLPDEEELYELIAQKIDAEVDDGFRKNIPVKTETIVEAEDASVAIIDFIAETKTDIVLIGQKFGTRREARYGHKVMSGADCDIMIIPERVKYRIQKILCTTDCSKESETAFKRALKIAEKTGAAVESYFLYNTAETYFPATTISSAETQKERFQKEYADFLERMGKPPESIRCHFSELDPSENQVDKVYKTAENENADLIVVGAAGAVADATTLLGNIAENFNNLEKKIPLLIIKNKKSKRFFLI